MPQLVELLARNKENILCERKSVYSDIDALNASWKSYDIRLRRGRSGCWMATRTFELAGS